MIYMKKFTAFIQKICFELKSRPLAGAAALLLLTAAVHFWAFSWVPYGERDSIRYLTGAIRWAEQGHYDLFVFPPLPCFLMKVLIQMGFSPDTAGRIYSFLPQLFIPLASYILALRLTGNRRLARYTGIMLIFHPLLIKFSIEPLRESVHVLLILLILISGHAALKTQKLLPWLSCALFTALGWCCRFETLEFVALAFIALFILLLQKRYKFCKAVCHFGAYFLCTVALWALLIVATGGKECFKFQFENYILNKWTLFVLRWKA